jgi:Saxitoxin biosynthesis operon protein SxtJ
VAFADKHEPTALELRYFGLLLAAFFGLIGVLAWRKGASVGTAVAIGSLGAVLALVYYAVPRVRRSLFLGWRAAFRPVERTVSFVTLAAAYYLVFTPVGLIMRALGRDPLERRFEPEARSYFVRRRAAADPARYFRQF